MANIPNRVPYGNLSCAWGVFQARFDVKDMGNPLPLNNLKHDPANPINPIDCCSGSLLLPTHLIQPLGRNKYCPFIQNRLDQTVCQWVASVDRDTQKSKRIGQTGIILEILDLIEPILTDNGRFSQYKWTSSAQKLQAVQWGDADCYIQDKLKEYGPLVSFYQYLQGLNGNISKSMAKDFFSIAPIEDVVVHCDCQIDYTLSGADWSATSADTNSRTATAMLNLIACAGLLRPQNYQGSLTPSAYCHWLNNGNQPGNNWILEQPIINNFQIKKAIHYKHFALKAVNRDFSCPSGCGTNLVNQAINVYGDILTNRRLLLIFALIKAKNTNNSVSLNVLAQCMINSNTFRITQSLHKQISFLNTQERHNLARIGCVTTLENDLLSLKYPMDLNACGSLNMNLMNQINAIINTQGVLV